MRQFLNIDKFIAENITGRSESLFANDLKTHDELLSNNIKGKKVMVIGGAGTIGSSFLKALLLYNPGQVTVVDINENGLTELVRDCRSSENLTIPNNFKTYPINFGDKVFEKVFMQDAPYDIIANFAAHKHVRSEKDIYSIEAMIENNVINAKKFLDLLVLHPPKHFFCVSTDKAANPVNIMGASKKLMEEVILAYSHKIKITTARFANVAFSNGSLLAGFIERLTKQQPLSCPSDVKRYFVSPQESGQICLLTCILGQSGDIFFPKLSIDSHLISFKDIAIKFLETLGFEVTICKTEEEAKSKSKNIILNQYPVYFFDSETSGEKLYEEFYTDEEKLDLDKFEQLGIIKNAVRRNIDEIDNLIKDFETMFLNIKQKSDVVKILDTFMPSFKHIETGMNLDQKM